MSSLPSGARVPAWRCAAFSAAWVAANSAWHAVSCAERSANFDSIYVRRSSMANSSLSLAAICSDWLGEQHGQRSERITHEEILSTIRPKRLITDGWALVIAEETNRVAPSQGMQRFCCPVNTGSRK